MYTIAVISKNKPTERSTVDADGLTAAVHAMLATQKATVTDADQIHVARLITDARAMADDDGFAALQFGPVAMTIRPQKTAATV